MKELDFDELDRAVNSLMENTPKNEPPKADDATVVDLDKTATTPSVVSVQPADTSAPQPTAASPIPASPDTSVGPSEATRQTVNLTPRRRGQFMDVVHPSSDMKTAETGNQAATPPPRPVSRQGATVQPVTAPVASTPQPATAPAPTPTAPPEPDTSASGSDWPDPIEVPAPADQPLTSPFLTDAKVEKRPLGGVPAETAEAAEASDLTMNDPNAQLPAEPDTMEAALPAELQGDVMAIESDSTTSPAAQPDAAPEVAPEPTPPAAVAAATAMPGDIKPQYKEEPSSGEQTNGSIYDTDAYHRPLDHPQKTKSGWLWVVWIVLILLVGAAAGAAFYYFELI